MNLNKWLLFIAFLLVSSALPASADELNDYVRSLYAHNATYTPVQLPANTQAQILQTQQLASGNYGMYVNVTTGPNAGNKVWLPYSANSQLMSLYTSQANLKANQSTDVLSQAKMMLANANLSGIRVPSKTAISKQTAEDLMGRVSSANEKLGSMKADCDDCELAKTYQRDTVNANEANASRREPVIINPLGITPSICRSLDNTMVFESCTYEGASSPSRFKITNSGPNSIVSKNKDPNRNRQFSFEAPGFATQDMMLKLTDSPSSRDKELQESYFMFFPRTALPALSSDGNYRVMTLPTGETVTFDVQGKIVDGPLKENQPLTAGSTAKVSYSGKGMTLRVDAVGSDPRMGSQSMAVISYGNQDCHVPKKDLWPDQRESSALHFKFASDKSFKEFLQVKCKNKFSSLPF